MKVTYIKTKDTELDIPEYTEELTRLFGMYLEEGFSIENGMYLIISSDDNKNESEYILFSDDKICNDFTSMFSKFNLLIDTKDITIEVKSDKCDIPLFIKSFESEESSPYDRFELDNYLELYTSKDDILDKINIYGIDHLTEQDKELLNL